MKNVNVATSSKRPLLSDGALSEPSRKRGNVQGKLGKYTGPPTAYFEVIQNGCFGRGRCLFLFTTSAAYLFNVPEGTERLLSEHGVRYGKLQHIFFTRGSWDNIGGLNGLILGLRKAGIGDLHLHGIPGISSMIRGAEHVCEQAGPPVRIQEHYGNDAMYEDCNIHVHYFNLGSDGKLNQVHKVTSSHYVSHVFLVPALVLAVLGAEIVIVCRKENSDPRTASPSFQANYAYLIRVKQKPPKLLLEKCVQQKVPVGPLLGKLQAGLDVQLDDGRIILSADVLEEPEPCPAFAIIECADIHSLNRLCLLKAFDHLLKADEKLYAVVHFTEKEVFDNSGYQCWLGQFKPETKHFVLNEFMSPYKPHSEAVFRFNVQLNRVSKNIFPFLHLNTYAETAPDSETTIMSTEPWLRFALRPNAGQTEIVKPPFSSSALTDLIESESDVVKEIAYFQAEADKHVVNKEDELPSLTFLGTSSAAPVRTRNVSGLLVHLTKDCSLLCDCGESTFQQICTLYDKSQALAVLRSIKFIFISHMHADHFFGLATLLLQRKLAFTRNGFPYEPVFLMCPQSLPSIMVLFKPYVGNLGELYRHIYTHRRKVMGASSLTNLQDALDALRLKRLQCVPVIHPMGAHGLVITTDQERTIVYSGDTRPCQELISAGQGADLLIHEATMEDNLNEEACIKKHCTISEAIGVGQSMGARFTLLTHFSGRYSKLPLVDSKHDSAPVYMGTDGDDQQPDAVSKKQLKRQRKREQWLLRRKERRKREQERRKQRRAEARKAGEPTKPGRKTLKRTPMESSQCRQRVAVDMSFDSLMSERDQQKAIRQLGHCYAVNRRAANPIQMYIVNFCGSSRILFDGTEGNSNWDVLLKSEPLTTVFDKSDIVYLSSESPNCLDELDETKVYVIGGLVDHNHYKGKCLDVAESNGIAHARLPIEEHMNLKTRRVLTINHVFEILLRYTESRSWKTSFDMVIPMRKRCLSETSVGPTEPKLLTPV
ncbi:zinc phosphodiesterase ELAC protein 2 [Trichuris trichiura]|uniref:Zinc phosphodiesterase ELAC protein 2 n=1 Tax=Trichuris trichiura TaxID=36087 RepID=A0A077ZJD8_TRITR|nr:zinc phosphodiesterase ELAC protein 2 [Trichuris trichiura]